MGLLICLLHPETFHAGRDPALEDLGGDFGGSTGSALQSALLSLLTFLLHCVKYSERSRKPAKNHPLYLKLRKETEPLQDPIPLGPFSPVGPPHSSSCSIASRRHGTGKENPRGEPPSVCVRVSLCMCVCVCSGCLAANGAWEAPAGGWFSLDDFP